MSKEIETGPEKYSAQKIVQTFYALQGYQCMERNHPGRNMAKISELENKLRFQVELWGGIVAIDSWLSENDPHHGKISTIKDLDLSWLT